MPESTTDALFAQACQLADDQREEFLRGLAPEVRSEVQALIDADAAAEGDEFLKPVPEVLSASPSAEIETNNTIIGPYKILQLIGEGGMGHVYMAEQVESVRRRVALKVIKTATPTKEILARFEAERQALAMMDHQNIAKVLDAGVTPDGRPYFAMELVKGVPITEYCDSNKLSPNERLELFGQTCRAIQHAHTKGIIHRDVKPSNVLVTLYDGKPVAKVIDFGLAKALQESARLTDRTMFTQFGQVVGTLAYMSPEQAELNALDVDTRTDVYSLGVILYELLTGSTPITEDLIRTEAFDRVLTLIREEETVRPSQRLSESGEAIAGISKQRQTEPKRLGGILKGDLDWIAVKALEKDRTRRYDTVAALADDVKRYLDGEAITARPPSLRYQLRKALRKHRRTFLTAGLILTLLIAGLIGTGTMWFRASKAESRALEQFAKAEAAEASLKTTLAEVEAERLRATESEKVAKEASQQTFETLTAFVHDLQTTLAELPSSSPTRRKLIETSIQKLGEVSKSLVAKSAATEAQVYNMVALSKVLWDLDKSNIGSGPASGSELAIAVLDDALQKSRTLHEGDPANSNWARLRVFVGNELGMRLRSRDQVRAPDGISYESGYCSRPRFRKGITGFKQRSRRDFKVLRRTDDRVGKRG